MALWNTAGSVVATNASKNIVGTGTFFVGNVIPGDLWSDGTGLYEIDVVTDNTHLTLVTNYLGTTGTKANGTWRIAPTSRNWSSVAALSASLGALINNYSQMVVATGNSNTLTLNKVASGNDAGILLKDNGVAFARLGGFGDDNLHLQVTADGTTYVTGLLVNRSNGQVSVGLGTAAAPALVFNADINTGFYAPVADAVAISIAGSEKVRVHTNGFVGIGNASPSSPLTVNQTQTDPASSLSVSALTLALALTANNAQQNNGLSINVSNTVVPAGVTYSGGLSGLRIDAFSNAAGFAGINTSQSGIWSRVGHLACAATAVTTSARAHYAEMRNDVASSVITNMYGFYAGLAGTLAGTITNLYDFYGADASARNYLAGTMGIGVDNTAAAARLMLNSSGITSGVALQITNSTTDAATKSSRIGVSHYTNAEEPVALIYGASDGTNNTLALGGGTSSMNAATILNFYTGATATTVTGTLAMSIDSAGRVVVGSTGTTTAKLFANQTGASLSAGQFDNISNATATVTLANHDTTGNNVLANFYTETSATLRGSISYNRTGAVVAYNTTSDQRLKEEIAGAFDFGAVIDAVAPRHYRRLDVEAENFGFFAQELFVAVPTAVTQGSDETVALDDPGFIAWQVDNSQLVPFLWAGLRDARARIAALESH